MLKEITSDNFDTIIAENDKILIDFSATWCGPCKLTKPLLERLSQTFNIGICDIDTARDISNRFGIRAVPTLIMFKDGKEVHRISGVPADNTIRELFA